MPIKLKSTSGGSVTLDTPATASDFTLTVPATTANVITSAGGTISGDTTFSNAVTFSSNNVTIGGSAISPVTGMRNRLINGDFKVWQRGTSFSAAGYTADRWTVDQTGTWARSTDVPSTSFQYSISCSATVAGGGSYTTIRQRIESVNSYDLAGKKVTLSFWVKNTSGSTSMYASFNYPVTTDNWSSSTASETDGFTAPYNTWTKITITTSNVLNAGVSGGLEIAIYAADASNTRTFLITGIQLEEGTVATPFERRPYGTELALCQRYYEKSWNQGTAPGSSIDNTGPAFYFVGVSTITAIGTGGGVQYKVTKRTAPTVTIYNYSGTANKVSPIDSTSSVGTTVTYNAGRAGDYGFSSFNDSGSGFTVGSYYWFGWTASAEL